MYKKLVRPLLFKLEPERAHNLVLTAGRAAKLPPVRRLIQSLCAVEDDRLHINIFGKTFRNPIGIAAGVDKDCVAPHLFWALGFGFLELGTVTGQPQPGNPRPRICRIPEDCALINRVGFPSAGADHVARRLEEFYSLPARPLIGINIGKTKILDLDRAAEDYVYSFSKVADKADFVAINVSSPNTPELRKLQSPERLAPLILALMAENKRGTPVLVKIAPDLSYDEIDQIVECCSDCGVAGLISCNTTFSREGLTRETSETGGMSGRPLRSRAIEIVSHLYRRTQGKIPIIGVGGIESAGDVIAMMSAGASLVQIYTALVYEGPGLIKKINIDLLNFLSRESIANISSVIGQAHANRGKSPSLPKEAGLAR